MVTCWRWDGELAKTFRGVGNSFCRSRGGELAKSFRGAGHSHYGVMFSTGSVLCLSYTSVLASVCFRRGVARRLDRIERLVAGGQDAAEDDGPRCPSCGIELG